MEELMLRIEHISKQYKLGQIGGTTLREEIQRFGAKIRHQEDPTKKIGAREYQYGESFMALDDVSFDIKKGERVGIIGRNGAGKSTLLKLISRVTAPTSGKISLNGRVASMLEVGTGFHGELTGRENIYMNGAILGMKKKEIDSKIEDIIEFSECRQFIDTPVKRYSSGMYVKLAFAVAAHLEAEIMIMDEVLAVGDVNFQQKCLKKMRSVAEGEGRTILYVSHNMNTIRSLCSRCIILNHGKLVFDGDVEDGIECYIQSDLLAHKRAYDVSKVKRLPEIPNFCRIMQIDTENCELTQGECLCFSLIIESVSEIKDIRLRFVLYNKVGTVVGTSYSEGASIYLGMNKLQYSLPTRQLAPDDYYTDIVLIEYRHGVQVRQDLILKVLFFSISETEPKMNMSWLTRSWGNIILEEISVCDKV